jgi:hypothetical protein
MFSSYATLHNMLPQNRTPIVVVTSPDHNNWRGQSKMSSIGTRVPKCSSRSFAQKGEETVPVEIREALLPLVRLAAALSADIKGVRQKD